MSTFSHTRGLPVLASSTAERVGAVKHFIVTDGSITALHVDGGKRHGLVVGWADLKVGDDAVVVGDRDALRETDDDREARALRGDLDIIGKRVLSDIGDEIGTATDATFNAESGIIESITIGDEVIDGIRLLGVGSYAVMVTAPDEA
jgi:uncharacterized protein YrrD